MDHIEIHCVCNTSSSRNQLLKCKQQLGDVGEEYKINMGSSHFHGIWDKHICAMSNRCILWSDMVSAIEFFIYLIVIFFLATNHDFGRWKHHLFDNLFLAHFRKCILKILVECPSIQLSTLNFHAQLEMNGILYIIKKMCTNKSVIIICMFVIKNVYL